ncbi:MAG: DNA repair protein RecO [bacterium]|nr:DNA repair protein RecO [Candidatus Kapabacteria bacterium]
MISRTDAIVLHARRFRESSKIVTLYTRQYGKISVVAKGVMQPRKTVAALLQPMAVVSAVIYMKDGRELQNLSTTEPLERYGRIAESLERMSAGLAIVELVNATMHHQDPNDELYETIVHALRALNSDGDERTVLLWFMTRLANVLGYTIRTEGCGVCDEDVAVETHEVAYSIPMGAPLCAEHRESSGYWPMSSDSFELLDRLQQVSAADAADIAVEAKVTTALHDALVAFVRYHVEGLRRLNVEMVMGKVLRPISDGQATG